MFNFDALSGADFLQPIFALACIGAVVYALTAKNVTLRAVAWGVMYACWFTALCSGGEAALAGAVSLALLLVPPVALAL
ncbi:MAG TPA: hypothetical protein VHG10_08035, partial [Glycomyces sp.]|nr:hypothetical protein [Glycomyces sp.]